MNRPLEFMKDLADRGEIVPVRLGPKRFIFAFDPNAAQEILVKKSGIYVQNRAVFDRIQPVTGKNGLVQLSGEQSQIARSKSRALFSQSSLDVARTITQNYCHELIQSIGSSGTLDISASMTDLILKTALKIFLGIDSEDIVSQIGTKFLRLNKLCSHRMRSLLPIPLLISTPENRQILNLQADIRDLISKHIDEKSNTGISKAFKNDSAIIDQCMTFLFAGHETTASSLAFTFLLLARNPKYQDGIAAGDEALTNAVYKEGLRLYPPAYMLARQAISDDFLCGIPIKRSDQVIVGITELHRNPKFFERPEEFIPERFLDNAKYPFSFIPFGAGLKSCVGERLAYVEANIVLTEICKNYVLSSNSPSIDAEALITLHPLPGQKIHLQSRNGS